MDLHLKTTGFKDLALEVPLSGLDLITSGNRNGAGKTAVIEALQLSLAGSIPGRAHQIDDILRFTSSAKITVEISVSTDRCRLQVERVFTQDGGLGARSRIRIDGIDRNYAEGHRWVTRRLGVLFPTLPFLDGAGPGCKTRRDWFFSYVLPAECPDKESTRFHTLARLFERFWGKRRLRQALPEHNPPLQAETPGQPNRRSLAGLSETLLQRFDELDTALGRRVDNVVGCVFLLAGFALWFAEHPEGATPSRPRHPVGEIQNRQAAWRSNRIPLPVGQECFRSARVQGNPGRDRDAFFERVGRRSRCAASFRLLRFPVRDQGQGRAFRHGLLPAGPLPASAHAGHRLASRPHRGSFGGAAAQARAPARTIRVADSEAAVSGSGRADTHLSVAAACISVAAEK